MDSLQKTKNETERGRERDLWHYLANAKEKLRLQNKLIIVIIILMIKIITDWGLLFVSDNLKAVDAAISSRQWQKAGQILQVVKKQPEVCGYYKKLAQHYANVGEYEVQSIKKSIKRYSD